MCVYICKQELFVLNLLQNLGQGEVVPVSFLGWRSRFCVCHVFFTVQLTIGPVWCIGPVTLLLVTVCKIRGLICFLCTLKGAEMDLVVIFPLYV